MLNKGLFFLLILMLSASLAGGQEATTKKLALLPFVVSGVEPVYAATAESILRVEISKKIKMDIISEKRIHTLLVQKECAQTDCAQKTGSAAGASFVAGGTFSALGDKIIVQYFLLDVAAKKEILRDQLTALSVEDLEGVMKRVATSLANFQPANKKIEVGTITAAETKKQLRRSSKRNIGISFGYLYPLSGYDNAEKTIALDLRVGHEMEDFSVGMLLGIRKGFAMNIYGSYLFSRRDFCPFIGGAFGFHWVTHNFHYSSIEPADDYDTFAEKSGDGFEFTVRGGARIFRTYNFQVIFNLAYVYTFNDFNDQAVLFTIGLL